MELGDRPAPSEYSSTGYVTQDAEETVEVAPLREAIAKQSEGWIGYLPDRPLEDQPVSERKILPIEKVENLDPTHRAAYEYLAKQLSGNPGPKTLSECLRGDMTEADFYGPSNVADIESFRMRQQQEEPEEEEVEFDQAFTFDRHHNVVARGTARLHPVGASVLEEAGRVVEGPRQGDYGHPYESFRRIANLWTAFLDTDLKKPLTEDDVAQMMMLLKQSRLKNTPGHRDSMVDIAGWLRGLEMVHEERERRGEPDCD